MTASATVAVAHADVLEPLPSDVRAARLADLGAVVGFGGLITLVLMFGIEVPRGGPFVFGTANDVLGAAFSAAFIPIAWRLARTLPRRPGLRAATSVAIGAAAGGTVLPLLLVAGAMPFAVQMPLVIACIEVQSLWLVIAGRAWRQQAGTERFGRLTQAIGVSFVAGSAVVGAGFALPDGPLRLAAWALGGAVGLVGYLGWPWWYRLAARQLPRDGR